MMSRTHAPLHRIACAAAAAFAVVAVQAEPAQAPAGAAAPGAPAATPAPVAPPAPVAIRDSVILSSPELEVRYELQPPQQGGQQGRAVVQGEVEGLRAQVRIEPGATQQPASGVDLSWAVPASPVGGLVVGDGYTSGAGWSAPSRITGLRFGRAQAMRAPLRADPAAFAAPVGFASVAQQPAGADVWRPEALRVQPAGPGPAAPTPGDAHPLQAGVTDYEVEVGRLREGWDTTDRRYLGPYAAAAYRAGLGLGFTAEARTEWSATGSAHGVEVLKELGGGAQLQGLAAQSVATEVGGGGRWGAGLVLPGDLWRWKLTYAGADREFRSATGGLEARRGVRLETRMAWRRGAVDASVSRNEVWDAAAPESVVALGSRLDLTRQVQLRMDLSRRVSLDPAWRAGVAVSLPIE